MNLALTPTFFKAYAALPQQVQDKTYELLLRFRQHPKGASLNYEKIKGLRDKQLRSLRVNDTYRAILHEPESGEGIYHFLWVDHHDEAYAWAQNKRFHWNSFTDAFQLIHLEEMVLQENVTVQETKEGPLSKLREDELLRLGVSDIFVDKIPGIISLNELEKWQPYLPVDAYEYLLMLITHTPAEDMLQEVEAGKPKPGQASWEAPNQRRFSHLIFHDEALKEALTAGTREWQLFLHPSQRRLAEAYFSGSVRVSGGAGTGKSVVAMHRAKHICEQWISAQDKPLLITTFTKSLTARLRENLAAMGLPQDRYEVNNLHNLAVIHAKRLGLVTEDFQMIDYESPEFRHSIWQDVLQSLKLDYDTTFLAEEYSEMILHRGIRKLNDYIGAHRASWQRPLIKNGVEERNLSKTSRKTIWKIMMAYEQAKRTLNCYEQDEVVNLLAGFYEKQADKPYSYIICDELQDFSQSDFRLLRAMVAVKANDLFLLGDPLQKMVL
ncbi:MAG: UvrD-helicase domain-containing protein [Cyclobacteriaceae bacterium]